MFLLILDSLGGSELLVILVVALVIFGPRKLPQLSRSLGRSLADFKRASQDFKETWEKEARFADELQEDHISRAMLPPEESHTISRTVERTDGPFSSTVNLSATDAANTTDAPQHAGLEAATLAATVARGAATADQTPAALVQSPSVRPVPVDPSLVRNSSAEDYGSNNASGNGGDASSSSSSSAAAANAASSAEPFASDEQLRKQDWL